MAELLLELLSEEIPARMQARAAADLKRLVTEKLAAAGLSFESAKAFVTPRRLAFVVDGLPERQPDRVEERKGPRPDAPAQAIEGFLASNGLKSLGQAELRHTGKGKFYFAVKTAKGQATANVLPGIIAATVQGLPWPKSMRWAGTQTRWVRPLHGVLAVFDGETLSGGLELGNRRIAFTNAALGHRFLAPKAFKVRNFADYKAKLKKAKVILDPAERRGVIEEQAKRQAKRKGLTVRDDPALVDENAGLVEWPVVLMGRIDPEFMKMPAEVLTTVLRHHQKYFALLDKKGNLAPYFLVVAGMRTRDRGRQIVAGNERVLRARLADAKFFWDQDRKRTLESRIAALDGVVFHAELGSVGDKVRRIEALAANIAALLKFDAEATRQAARLAKADLTTEMVGEFPELQGIMGRYYALQEGMPAEVADAIAGHYSPLGPNDPCPTAPVSVAVALADKIDTLVGFFAIGERPTGSKDPYALRRAALGVIRLIDENKVRLPLAEMFRKAHVFYGEAAAGALGEADPDKVARELLDFFADRLKVHLKEKGVRHDLVSAVFALGGEDDLVRLLKRVEALEAFLDTDDGANLLVAYQRAANIVRIEQKRDQTTYDGGVEAAAFRQDEEKDLHRSLAASARASSIALENEDFTKAMAALARLRGPVDAFFDTVTVNAEDPRLRENRLRLLSQIAATLNRVADFSRIEG